MKNIITIMKKEIKRFFTDKRMLLSLFLPGILIFLLYSLMGNFLKDALNVDNNYEYNIAVFNSSDEFDLKNIVAEKYTVNIVSYEDDKFNEMKKALHENDDIDLIIYFSKNFDIEVNSSSVSLYYNSTSNESMEIYNYYYAYLFNQSKKIDSIFKVNEDLDEVYDVATKEDSSIQTLSMLLPLILIMLLFSGCLSVATESIAGEKERGTIATLLITPVKRSEIAIGKILSLGFIAIISSLSSFLGLILSLPKLTEGDSDISFSMYGIEHFLGLLCIILILVCVFISLLSVISALSKSVKEASSYSVPIMIVVTAFGFTAMLSMGEVATNHFLYLIPIYNATQCMTAILSLKFNGLDFLLTVISNFALCAIVVFALVKIFNSERIMYSK